MNTILITLFEKQIIRNYTSDKLNFISELAAINRVLIFTNTQNFELLSSLMKETNRVNIEVFTFNLRKFSFYSRIVFGLLKWSHGSTTIIREIRLNYTLNNSALRYTLLKILINCLFKNMYGFDSFLRYLVLKNFDRRKFLSCLSPNIYERDLINCKSVFITSLTNRNDLQFALFAKVMKFKSLGTVRSWDNLTSHGNLIIKPDLFYSHSQFMTDTLIEFHKFDPERIVTLSCPNYREIFHPRNSNKQLKTSIKVGFGCMGNLVNPDDKNFMIYFNNEAKLHPDKEFFIFQHPIFPHKIDFDLSSNLKVLQFDYDKFNLAQYYDALSQLDLLVAGGSSILLDAAFLKIQIAFIAFEIVPQNFWVSALRYKDFVYHFHKFIEITGVKVIRSRKEFVDVVNEVHLGQCIVDSDLSNYFTGDIETNLSHELFRLLDFSYYSKEAL